MKILNPVFRSTAPQTPIFGGLGLLRVRVHVAQPMAL
jgi:hypothetical protein